MALSQTNPPAAFRKQVMTRLGESYGDKTLVLCPTAFVKLLDGDHKAAILLSQILYWSDRTKDPDGWFYKSYQEWQSETGLSEAQVRRIVNGDPRVASPRLTLRDLGVETLLRKVKRTGAPTLHYRINQAQFLAALERLIGRGDSQQSAGTFPDNQQDQSLTESAMNAGQSAPSLILPETNNINFMVEDQPSQNHSDPDDDLDEVLFNRFENRFGKPKEAQLVTLQAEVTRLGTPKVREVLERCATRGRSWNYVVKALANEQPSAALPSDTSRQYPDWVCTGSEADLPVFQTPEPEPELPISARVETLWKGTHTAFPTVRASWEAALHQTELQFGVEFHSWGRGLTLVDYEPDSSTLIFVARSAYARDLLQSRLYRTVRRIVNDVSGQPVELRFVLREAWLERQGISESEVAVA